MGCASSKQRRSSSFKPRSTLKKFRSSSSKHRSSSCLKLSHSDTLSSQRSSIDDRKEEEYEGVKVSNNTGSKVESKRLLEELAKLEWNGSYRGSFLKFLLPKDGTAIYNVSFRRSTSSTSSASSTSQPPMFDPSLISTVEKALETAFVDDDDDDWLVNSASNTDTAAVAAAAGVDLIPRKSNGYYSRKSNSFTVDRSSAAEECSQLRRHLSDMQTCLSYKNEEGELGQGVGIAIEERRILEDFEEVCPPGGGGRVVLYSTSLRAVRKTFENCNSVRLFLQGLQVRVDERDVWMHSSFRHELSCLLPSIPGVQVPRLFIKGRYIGGAEEVKLLHEEGILAKLILQATSHDGDGFANLNLSNLVIDEKHMCEGCGDLRFVPCLTCNGSCKLFTTVTEGLSKKSPPSFRRCPNCNENGLIMCPICSL